MSHKTVVILSNGLQQDIVQGDNSPWRKPPVDIDAKVAF